MLEKEYNLQTVVMFDTHDSATDLLIFFCVCICVTLQDPSESHPSHHCLFPQPAQMSAASPVHAGKTSSSVSIYVHMFGRSTSHLLIFRVLFSVSVPEVVVPTAAQQPVFMETVVPQAVDCGGSSHDFQVLNLN